MTLPLYDLARFYRHNGLVGEERGGITLTLALAGGASVAVRGQSGTGKTHMMRAGLLLYREDKTVKVDMVSKLSVWSKPKVKQITEIGDDGLVYMPEQQNAGDNDEIVKVLKKWGDGSSAEREKSEEYGNDMSLAVLPARKFLTSAALTNEAHQKSFDPESARRVIKVKTNASEETTRAVTRAWAAKMRSGKKAVRVLDPLSERKIVRFAQTVPHLLDITDVRLLGAEQIEASVPAVFPEARSAVVLFEKVLLGVGRWYSEREVVVDGEVFLSPRAIAETWAFYGDTLLENALKMDAMDAEILGAIPQPSWNGAAISPDSVRGINDVMASLKKDGVTDPGLVKRQIGHLVTKGFLMEAEGYRTPKWHRTNIADFATRIDWPGLFEACRTGAAEFLDGAAREKYLALCADETMQNPITGAVGPIHGEGSVLYFDKATQSYTKVGAAPAPDEPKGIEAWA